MIYPGPRTVMVRGLFIHELLEIMNESTELINEILQSGTRQEIYKKIRPFAEKYRNMQIAEDVYSTIYAASAV